MLAEFIVDPPFCYELRVTAEFHYIPFMYDGNPVCVLYGRQTMSYHYTCSSLSCFVKGFLYNLIKIKIPSLL